MHPKEKGKIPAADRQQQWLPCFLFSDWERTNLTGFDMLLFNSGKTPAVICVTYLCTFLSRSKSRTDSIFVKAFLLLLLFNACDGT